MNAKLKLYYSILTIFIALLSVFTLWQSAQIAQFGLALQQQQQTNQKLSTQKIAAEHQLVKAQSLSTLKNQANQAGFLPITSIAHLPSEQNIAVLP